MSERLRLFGADKPVAGDLVFESADGDNIDGGATVEKVDAEIEGLFVESSAVIHTHLR